MENWTHTQFYFASIPKRGKCLHFWEWITCMHSRFSFAIAYPKTCRWWLADKRRPWSMNDSLHILSSIWLNQNVDLRGKVLKYFRKWKSTKLVLPNMYLITFYIPISIWSTLCTHAVQRGALFIWETPWLEYKIWTHIYYFLSTH